ncbi:MAG: hypothetical protein IJA47_01990 [Oscillospiraceae bacterium]|nr:hypothetical protein [Oscillospiraceae bacterium]
MDTMQFNKQNTLAVAHRGLSGIETENTNAAFVAAGNRSYYGIETDIHRTADGKFVVIHDNSLTRVAGIEMNVEEMDLSALQEVVLFDKDGSKNRVDLRLPVLDNYISICKKYGKHCVLELKSDFTQEEIGAIVNIIKEHDYLDSVTFISFVYDNLTKIRSLLPNQSAQFLFKQFEDGLVERLVADKLDVDVYHKVLTEDIVAMLHSNGLTVNCWTVDDKERAEELAQWGVDYITTNILE